MNAVASSSTRHAVSVRFLVAATVAVVAVVALIVALLTVTSGSSDGTSQSTRHLPVVSQVSGATSLADNSTCHHVLRGAC